MEHFCDLCRARVTSQRRIDAYADAGVDWVICAKCERESRERREAGSE